MFLSTHQIAQTRQHALNNFHGFSSACLDAGQRISELIATSSRESLALSGRQIEYFARGEFAPQADQPLWQTNGQTTQFIEQIYAILGDTHKALIAATEAQIRVFDEIAFASIDHGIHFSPWETAVPLGLLRSTLADAENTLHDMSTAAIDSVDHAEQEIAMLAEEFVEPKKSRRTVARKALSTAQ